jgi:hypothetical protein
MGILDTLYTTKYIVFLDIEFQTIVHNPYILELGIIIFEKNIENPILIDHVNFPLLYNENLRLLGLKYCTVSSKTEIEMKNKEAELYINVNDINSIKDKEELIEFIPDRNVKRLLREVIKTSNMSLITNPEKTQKIIDQMYFNLFKNRMKGKYKIIYNDIIKLYIEDELVKKRTINPQNYLNRLKPYFNNMTLVHKEGMDIIALNKDLKKYDVKIENKIFHKDIAVYNDIFRKKYNTAKLYESYVHLKHEYINNHVELKDFELLLEDKIKEKMPVIKPHNPLSDTYFTIFIFLIMAKYYTIDKSRR